MHDAALFRYGEGRCAGCAPKAALWYFQNEGLALPLAGPGAADAGLPDLVWLGAPQLVPEARLSAAGDALLAPGAAPLPMRLAPKIAANRSYFDASSLAFFQQRAVRVRGTLHAAAPTTPGAAVPGQPGQASFEARTIWPRDFVIDAAALRPQALTDKETLAGFVRQDGGGARSAYGTRLVWQRPGLEPGSWQGKPVLAFMLNGAQGDDDEAYGGHFAVATGRLGPKGEWADWLVNNFYNLDSYSEKGIIAGVVPMDNYLMDLNSGQQYYRPSHMLVAVLRDTRSAQAFQTSVQQRLRAFYRHDFTYNHAAANCAGISIDVLRQLGWHVPEQGPSGRLMALGAYAYMAVKDGSLASGRRTYDYYMEERTRLYPALAFTALGEDLLRLLGGQAPGRALSAYERQLRDDVEAVLLVRIPQVPSSRAFGSAPVFSIGEYLARVPEDKSDWQIVPVPPRPFPAELRDGPAPVAAQAFPVPLPVGGLLLGVMGAGAGWHWRRRMKRESVRDRSGVQE